MWVGVGAHPERKTPGPPAESPVRDVGEQGGGGHDQVGRVTGRVHGWGWTVPVALYAERVGPTVHGSSHLSTWRSHTVSVPVTPVTGEEAESGGGGPPR